MLYYSSNKKTSDKRRGGLRCGECSTYKSIGKPPVITGASTPLRVRKSLYFLVKSLLHIGAKVIYIYTEIRGQWGRRESGRGPWKSPAGGPLVRPGGGARLHPRDFPHGPGSRPKHPWGKRKDLERWIEAAHLIDDRFGQSIVAATSPFGLLLGKQKWRWAYIINLIILIN